MGGALVMALVIHLLLSSHISAHQGDWELEHDSVFVLILQANFALGEVEMHPLLVARISYHDYVLH